jgi:hypothetical protein
MPFLVAFLVLFIAYVKENDRLSEATRATSVGIIVVIVVLYLIFGIILG